MNTQATRCTPKQLAYLAYWQARGHQFGRNEAIPESIDVTPSRMDKPRTIELVATLAAMIAIGVWQYAIN